MSATATAARAAHAFVCPLDGLAFAAAAGSVRCAAGHSFDLAREGYLNLLPVQHKASRDPGDSRAMVEARQRVLAGGHFAPVSAALVEEVLAALAIGLAEPDPIVLDAGCGEGWYLAQLAQAFAARSDAPRPAWCGIDISRWAIRAAARRGLDAAWAVASNRQLPLAPQRVDLLLSLFGFPVWPAFARVQAASGAVLLAEPGPAHLRELRNIIYPRVIERAPPSHAAAAECGYRVTRERTLYCTTLLPSAARIADLLTMTPHAHRAPAAGQAALAGIEILEVSIDVVFRLFRRA